MKKKKAIPNKIYLLLFSIPINIVPSNMDFLKICGIFLLLFACGRGQRPDMIPDCSFEDTVDLTNASRNTNGQYLYGNALIAADQVGIYDHEELFNGEIIPRSPHLRGCLCKERTCIRFCCNPSQELPFTDSGRGCRALDYALDYDPYLEVTLEDGSKEFRNVVEDFTVMKGIPCENGYVLKPDQDEWELLENGIVLRHHDMVYLSKSEYCLMPTKMDDEWWVLTALNCPKPNTAHLNIGATISTPFIILTVLLYFLRPELRNLRGKCIICCLTAMALGNIILIAVSISDVNFPLIICRAIGFTVYFLYESTFMWLTLIGYDLWRNSRSFVTIFNQRQRFLNYSEFAWGVPLLLDMILIIIQNSDVADKYKPNIDHKYCWWKSSNWSATVYYFGLNAAILCLNTAFCLWTACKQLPYMRQCEELRRYVRALEKSLCEYLLLLLVMGISWCLKMAAYVEHILQLETNEVLLYTSESMNIVEGPLIFFVLVVITLKNRRRWAVSEAFETQLHGYFPKEDDVLGKQPLRNREDVSPLLVPPPPHPPPIVITSQMR